MPSIDMNGGNVIVITSCAALATVWAFMRRALEPHKRLSIIAYPSLLLREAVSLPRQLTLMNRMISRPNFTFSKFSSPRLGPFA
jgi:hypothetical protein